MSNLCFLISSCDKYSDLWENHFKLLFKNWEGESYRIYLLTDKPTSRTFDGVTILVVEEESLPLRLHRACELIDCQYLFVSLDDYYLVNKAFRENFDKYLSLCKTNKIDYLSIYNRRYTKKKYYKPIDDIKQIDLENEYAVNLYPAIWSKDFLLYSSNNVGSPWEFEPKLRDFAKEYNANCFYNIGGAYDILDVIRKGKLLKKARVYLKKNGYELPNRENLPLRAELKQSVADFVCWHFPKSIYKCMRSIGTKFGMKSYSLEVEKKKNEKK